MARRKKHSRDTFSFIHVSHPDGFKDKETQNKIRRHAMGAAGQLRLKPPRNPTVSVDIPPNATIIVGQSRQSLFKRPQQQIVPHIAFLGTYPVETSTRARQLIHFMQVAGNLHLTPFRHESYSLATADPAAFYLYLANAAFLHNHLTQKESNQESSKYLGVCLSQVITRLESEAPRVSPGLIYTMLGLACHETHLGNWDRRAVHLNGLERAVKARGGLESLSQMISLLIFWFDVLESSSRDCVPRYAIPAHLRAEPSPEGTMSSPLTSVIERLTLYGNHEIAGALKSFRFLVDFISHKAHDDKFWNSSSQGASLITPITHSLLSMPRPKGVMGEKNDDSGDYVIEMARIALLIILARLKQTFSFPTDELSYLQERFRILLFCHSGSEFPDLELLVCGLCSLDRLGAHGSICLIHRRPSREAPHRGS
uniref:Transcription factor domain-containing protein n=1 Tax=Bionectria ochroleuca TaxID=29856 RepID=A0A8H7KDT1_BIOOC